jgi:hypothetical protein
VTCPVCVWHATNVDAAALAGFDCHNCGRPLGEHPTQASVTAPPDTAYMP